MPWSRLKIPALCVVSALCAAPAFAATAQNCGTIIIPPGIGAGPGADITSFNPLLAESLYNAEAGYMMFTLLVWIGPDHKVDVSRSLASAITTPDQGTTFHITLRPWHWSDGVQVTAADVLYTFNLAKQLGDTWPDNGTGGMPDIVKSFTIQDPTHFTITLKRQVNPEWFILNGLFCLQPVPAHIWSRYTLDQIWQHQSSPSFFQVVDGPLIPQKLAIGLDAVFRPNPHYEGAPLHFTRLIMKFVNDENAELQAVESGDLDMANLPFALFSMGQTIPGLHVESLPAGYGFNEFIPNIASPTATFFADLRVRQALAAAINQPQIIQLAMHGQGLPVYSAVPPYPATFLSPEIRSGAAPDKYDPAKAKSLLQQAGFTPGPNGILQKNGKPLSFTALVSAGRPEDITIAETVQQNLAAVGIDMKVHQIEFNQLLALEVGPPAGWQSMFLATTINAYPSGENGFLTGSFYDQNGYSNPQMDATINASTYQPGLAGLFAYEDLSAIQQPVTFLPIEEYPVLVRDGLHGVQNFINPLGYWDPAALYCTTTQAAS
jgi:peptide/nickel transport system substrate-binding protein